MKKILFDIETDGLLHEMTKIHCIVMMTPNPFNSDDWALTYYQNDKIHIALEELKYADELIGHNIINFDIPAIQKICPDFLCDFKGTTTDTLVLSRLAYSDIKNQMDFDLFKSKKLPGKLIGSHSLKSWGYRLGELKGEFSETTDWKEFSQEMLEYCKQDIALNLKLYQKLMSLEMTEESVNLEMGTMKIIKRQMEHGFCFDKEKAEKLYLKLIQRKGELQHQLNNDPMFKPFYTSCGELTPKRDNKTKHYQKGSTLTKIKLIDFNPGSTHHIAYWLKRKYGWEPLDFTPTGLPKVDEDTLSHLKYPEAEPLIEYYVIKKRLGQLGDGSKAWLKLMVEEEEEHEEGYKIKGYVNTNGAMTGRMTHSNPNLAQVPGRPKPYWEECRELFRVPNSNYKLVGADASGLELRCLAHYIKPFQRKGEIDYAKEILEGDIHTVNMQALGLTDRSVAKTWIYAFIYGAGNKKLGKILGKGVKEGRIIRGHFFKKVPALARITKAISSRLDDVGYLKGLDGRKLPIRGKHAALNTLLQSAGAVIMKRALIILDEKLKNYVESIPYEFVANIHDEWQIQVGSMYGELVGTQAVEAIRRAGEYYNLRIPLTGEYKIGNNWKETH